MSLSSRPNLLRAAVQSRALWLAVPAIAALILLAFLGHWAVNTPAPISVAEAEPAAQAATEPAAATGSDEGARGGEGPRVHQVHRRPEERDRADRQKLSRRQPRDLRRHPERTRREDGEGADREAQGRHLAELRRDLSRAPTASVGGNPDGDITVVEFFDYNCGYCKRGLHDVVKLVETDPKVRVVFKELPILSKGSEEASRVALAAQRQGKYWELHKAMLGAKGQMNEAAALQIAEKLGLDMTKLKADMASPEVKAEVDKSEALAKKMGVNGTPHFLIGDRAIAGAPEDLYDQLAKNVGELRKQGCSYC